MSRIPTIGCRRCGGGLAGEPFVSNVRAGARLSNELATDFTVFEGSGSAMPPVAADVRVAVAGANQPIEYIIGYLGPYRILISDLVVLTNCEATVGAEKIDAIISGIKRIKPAIDVVQTIFRPLPLGDISGKKIFFATTAPESANAVLREYLESKHSARGVGISHHLSNRPLLREDLAKAEGGFDVLLTELKAAAVDVATAVGLELGKQVVYCDNEPVTLGGRSLSSYIMDLAELARVRFKERKVG